MYQKIALKKGIALLEVVIGLSIISVSLIVMLSNFKAYLTAAFENTQTIKAAYLAEETFESVRFLRDENWAAVAAMDPSVDYYLYWDGVGWNATSTPQGIDGFSRSFRILPAYRDASYDITDTDGTLDDGTKKVEVTVAWNSSTGTTTKVLDTYMTHLFEN